MPEKNMQEEKKMTINKQQTGAELTLAVNGRLDTTTAPELEKELNASLNGAESLILDFSKLEYISSAGLRVLLSAQKQMSKKGGMKVRNVNEVVQEVFEVTGFADILTIE
jgi:anti-sigma B factor antagonist